MRALIPNIKKSSQVEANEAGKNAFCQCSDPALRTRVDRTFAWEDTFNDFLLLLNIFSNDIWHEICWRTP